MSKAQKEKKVPKRVQRIVDACRGGQTLCRSIAPTRLGTCEDRWFLHPSNKEVSRLSATEASLLLIPRCDGLFGADTSQTWGA